MFLSITINEKDTDIIKMSNLNAVRKILFWNATVLSCQFPELVEIVRNITSSFFLLLPLTQKLSNQTCEIREEVIWFSIWREMSIDVHFDTWEEEVN